MNQCGAAEFETDENGNKVRARRRSEPDAHRPTGMEEGQSSVGGRQLAVVGPVAQSEHLRLKTHRPTHNGGARVRFGSLSG